jgi:hypothetical protein
MEKNVGVILDYFKAISQNLSRSTGENSILSQDSQLRNRDLNLVPSEYEAGTLTTQQRRSLIPRNQITHSNVPELLRCFNTVAKL